MSLRGYVAELGGELVGLGGLYYENGIPVAFSYIRDALRRRKKDVVKGCRILLAMVNAQKGPVYAVADPEEPTSAALLAKLGWEPTGRICPLGDLLVRG